MAKTTDEPSRHLDRRALRRVLSATYGWLDDPMRGPRAVVAGECDRCGARPRLLPTCGPVAWTALCRECAEDVGDDGWCDGHREAGRDARGWAAGLPEEWPTIVRLWWVATGEVRVDLAWIRLARQDVNREVAALLPEP